MLKNFYSYNNNCIKTALISIQAMLQLTYINSCTSFDLAPRNHYKHLRIAPKKYEIKIIAYCIMGNHAHILVYTDKIVKLSNFMHDVNTTFTLYYNKKNKSVGDVFRNRYRYEAIFSEKQLINCIQYIHRNPTNAKMCENMLEYKYSNYREYKLKDDGIIKNSLTIFPEINKIFINNIDEKYFEEEKFTDFKEDKDYIDKGKVISKFIQEKDIKREDIKKHMKEIAEILKEKCGITHQEIANELGVSRVEITKILNKKD